MLVKIFVSVALYHGVLYIGIGLEEYPCLFMKLGEELVKLQRFCVSGAQSRHCKHLFLVLSKVCVIIPKESIIFRAIKKEQLIEKLSCSECDSFRLYQGAEL